MLRLFRDIEALSDAAARLVVETGRTAVASRGRFDLVLSGGSTPRLTYEKLASEQASEKDLWDSTHLWWGDERCVPRESGQSNYRLAAETLIDPLGIPPARVHPMDGTDADPAAAAARYDDVFPEEVDLILLGLGADGHTASLFPGSEALAETERRFIAVVAPVEPHNRITITPPAIETGRLTVVLVSGPEKADAFRRVFSAESTLYRTPARLVRGATWLADQDAAAGFIRDAAARLLSPDK